MAEHWCKEHKQPFFKKGKMKGFAHPILDDEGEPTGAWCNEPKVEGEDDKPETKATGRSYGKSDKELAQIKQLAEAQNRSIQAQTALNRAVDLAIADKITLHEIGEFTKEMYIGIQSLTQISEAEVIRREIKPGKVPTEQTGQLSREEARAHNNRGGETPVKDAKTLMEWALSHGKQYHNSWVRKEASLGDAVITEAMAIKAYQEICTVQGWT